MWVNRKKWERVQERLSKLENEVRHLNYVVNDQEYSYDLYAGLKTKVNALLKHLCLSVEIKKDRIITVTSTAPKAS